eukprot:6182540-Pleurochrysis_carterae.AAC.1
MRRWPGASKRHRGDDARACARMRQRVFLPFMASSSLTRASYLNRSSRRCVPPPSAIPSQRVAPSARLRRRRRQHFRVLLHPDGHVLDLQQQRQQLHGGLTGLNLRGMQERRNSEIFE